MSVHPVYRWDGLRLSLYRESGLKSLSGKHDGSYLRLSLYRESGLKYPLQHLKKGKIKSLPV